MKTFIEKSKKAILFVTILALSITAFAIIFKQPDSYAAPVLTDVIGHWAETDIKFMQSKGAVSGYPDGTFKPNDNITNGESIKLISAYFDNTIENGTRHWADNYLKFAEENEIAIKNKYTNTLDEKSTRKEIVYMIYNSLINVAYKPVIENDELNMPFPDVNSDINEDGIDYCEAIKACYLLGIIIGDDNGNMNPSDEITRAEITTIIARAYNEDKRKYSTDIKEYMLPADATNYRKIYSYMPNSFYEAGADDWAKYHENATPYLYQDFGDRDVSYAAQTAVRQKIEVGMGAMLNVSYKMTDSQWQEWKQQAIKMDDIKLTFDSAEEDIDAYIQYVKDNKIEIRGGVLMNTCTLGYMYTNFQPGKAALAIKGYINYEIVSNPNKVKQLTVYDYNSSKETIANIPNPEYLVVYMRNTGFTNELYDVQTRGMWVNIIGKE